MTGADSKEEQPRDITRPRFLRAALCTAGLAWIAAVITLALLGMAYQSGALQ